MSPSLTQSVFLEGITTLGVQPGMMLEVHCSLSSFDYVEGGADTIIRALQQAVGSDGAIVMPSFRLSPDLPLNSLDQSLGLTLKVKILHEDDEKSAMGIVSDTFRKLPDVITGDGLFRVSAWGKDAKKHSAGFQHLIDSGGYALLLGVDIYRLSSMHYVEDHLPDIIRQKFKSSQQARKLYPESDWFIESWLPLNKPWYTIQDRAYEKGYIKDMVIGGSNCMLLKVKDVLELYRTALINEPLKLYGLE